MDKKNIIVRDATKEDSRYAEKICTLIFESAQQRGTGIARRTPEYIIEKMESGKAVVALDGERIVGFSYIETWSHGDFVATSGLIVDPEYRGLGIATRIKKETFRLARTKYPQAKIFSITTSLAVMKLNTKLGYKPVTFSELTQDDEYWKGCEGCTNYDILVRTHRDKCLCTGMLFDPASTVKNEPQKSGGLTPYFMAVANWFKNLTLRKK